MFVNIDVKYLFSVYLSYKKLPTVHVNLFLHIFHI